MPEVLSCISDVFENVLLITHGVHQGVHWWRWRPSKSVSCLTHLGMAFSGLYSSGHAIFISFFQVGLQLVSACPVRLFPHWEGFQGLAFSFPFSVVNIESANGFALPQRSVSHILHGQRNVLGIRPWQVFAAQFYRLNFHFHELVMALMQDLNSF